MMKNCYKEQYEAAIKAMHAARDAAVQAVKDAKHFPVIANDGIPAWDRCFFGETRKAYEEAEADFFRISALYLKKEDELKALAKQEKAEWEAAHPEEAAAKKRKAALARYKRLAAQKEAAILKLQEELKELEEKMEALEG